jgi:hypothetical protein
VRLLVFLLGLVLMIIGFGTFSNQISLRAVLYWIGVIPAAEVTQGLRSQLPYGIVQGLQLTLGLFGLVLATGAAWPSRSFPPRA